MSGQMKNDPVSQLRRQLDGNGAIRHCLNCEHHKVAPDGIHMRCALAPSYDAQPPASIIAYGCEKWSMEIPF